MEALKIMFYIGLIDVMNSLSMAVIAVLMFYFQNDKVITPVTGMHVVWW